MGYDWYLGEEFVGLWVGLVEMLGRDEAVYEC